MTALDDQILDLMRRVSERAILPRYRNLAAGEVEDKGGNDPVTIADKDSEALLRPLVNPSTPLWASDRPLSLSILPARLKA